MINNNHNANTCEFVEIDILTGIRIEQNITGKKEAEAIMLIIIAYTPLHFANENLQQSLEPCLFSSLEEGTCRRSGSQ